MQAQSESQVLSGMRRGQEEAADHPPSLSMQQQQQQQRQMQQAFQMQHAFQQQQQMQHALALLATGGSGPFGNPYNDPSGPASLRGGFPTSGFPNALPPFAAMDPSLLRLLHPSLSSLSSDAGLSVAFARPSITSQRLLGGQQTTAAAAGPPYALPANMDRIEDLYMDSDDDVLSAHQIIVRQQIEFFVASQEDIDNFTPGRRKELSVGQVGIRCKHCTVLPHKLRPRGAAYFPSTLRALYQAAQNMASVHLTGKCQQISPALKEQLVELQETKSVSGHAGKKYWAEGAMARGVYESEMGLRFRDG
jgi:type II secretory pathway pseudopilin PulG